MIKSIPWLLPFLFFIGGYIGAKIYFTPQSCTMPSLVGMPTYQALSTLSKLELNPRILAHKKEADLPPGTILQQIPAPHQKVKPKQTIYMVLSESNEPPYMPQCIQHKITNITQQCTDISIPIHIHRIPHSWPYDTCFAQWPNSTTPVIYQTPIVYVSNGTQQPIIWPNFIGNDADNVITFLHEYNIIPDMICHYTSANQKSYKGYTIINQRPLAGSIISLENPENLMVQLRIE